MEKELEWLLNRGLTMKTIQEAGLTWTDGKIKIPWRVDGKEVGYQIRWVNEKRFQFNEGFKPSLYLPTGKIDARYDRVFVTEGAIDALTLQQLGFATVAIPSATLFNSIGTLPVHEICLALDNDEPGNIACEQIAALGTPHKLFRVKYEGKDPNECYLANNKTFPHTVVPYIVGGIKHIKEIHLNGNISDASLVTFRNGMPSWNAGDLVVLYGREKSGKSSWILDAISNEVNVPILLESYEMLPERVKDWYQKLGGTDAKGLYLTTEFKEFSLHNLFARIHSAISQLGVKLVVLDHVHFLASGKENIVNILANVTQRLKLLAMQYKICVVVLAHETNGEIRDCRLVGGNSDHILHLKRLNNAVIIEGKHRYHPPGEYAFNFSLKGEL